MNQKKVQSYQPNSYQTPCNQKRKLQPKTRNPEEDCKRNLAKSCIETCKKSPKELPSKTIVVDNKMERQDVAMSLTKTNSKIHKPKSYYKAINNPIYDRYWRKTIKQELHNLENHQRWKYNEFLPR